MATDNPRTHLHERFRAHFLDDLPARIDEVARTLKTPDAQWNAVPTLLFTQIHGIRGSAATFGLHIIASACQQLEDYLGTATDGAAPPPAFANTCRGYLDAMHEALREIREHSETFERTERKLAALRASVFGDQFTVALAFNSPSLTELCAEVAATTDARVLRFSDSMSALQALLNHPCNVLLVSSETYPLRGEALIAALKLSPTPYRRTSILVCSSPRNPVHTRRALDPDHVILRDTNFATHLQTILMQLHGRRIDK